MGCGSFGDVPRFLECNTGSFAKSENSGGTHTTVLQVDENLMVNLCIPHSIAPKLSYTSGLTHEEFLSKTSKTLVSCRLIHLLTTAGSCN